MGKSSDSFWDTAIYRRGLSRWAYAARKARTAKLHILRRQSTQAQQLRAHLDALINVAEERLADPLEQPEPLEKPHNADWAWRPAVWRVRERGCNRTSAPSGEELGSDTKVFHDCPRSELTFRQLRSLHPEAGAPYGLRLEVFNFEGGFLSLVLDLPPEASWDLSRMHILKIAAKIELETPLEVFARLNIAHGPNTEQMVREFDVSQSTMSVEFDLAYANLSEKRVDKCWIDLIFDNPRMNMIELHDLTLSRRPRAQV